MYLCDTWYVSFCVDDCLVFRVCIDTVVSPDDGDIVARNMYRKEINILRNIVHQVGFIYKIIQGCTVNKTSNSELFHWLNCFKE